MRLGKYPQKKGKVGIVTGGGSGHLPVFLGYVGDGMMIHAPRTGDVVKYQSMETDYYRSQYAGARRVY